MSDQLQHELKKEFQLERMILFSDAVFAIAITLLALEIKIPEIDKHVVTDKILSDKLDEMIPKFVGFLVSFFIIGLYWSIHHRMFGFVVNYTRGLLWLNLFFLLAIILMPFSTGFYSTYIVRFLNVPVIVYVSNIVFLGIMNVWMWYYLNKPRLKLVDGITLAEKKYYLFRAIAVPLVFILYAVVYLFIAPRIAVWLPPLIPIIMWLIRRFYFKKNNLKA